jgi:hypothetical protein
MQIASLRVKPRVRLRVKLCALGGSAGRGEIRRSHPRQ